MANDSFRITGRVIDRETEQGLAGLQVEAWDKDVRHSDLLGSAQTDERGRFEIEFDASHFQDHPSDQTPDVFFKVFRGEMLVTSTEGRITWNMEEETETVVIPIGKSEEAAPHPAGVFRVSGRVLKVDGAAVPEVLVRAFGKRLREEVLLGETRTDTAGRYVITTEPDEETAARGVNLVLRVFAGEEAEEELGASPLLFDARPGETVDIVVTSDKVKPASEYEKLEQALALHLEDAEPASLSDEEIGFVAGQTGLKRDPIAHYVLAHKLQQKTDAPPEALYGVLRRKKPASLTALLVQEPGAHRKALEEAAEANVIGDGGDVDAAVEALQNLSVRHVLEAPEEGNPAPLAALLETSGLEAPQREHFLQRYARHEGSTEAFWTTLRDDPAFAEDEELVEQVQFTLQLGAVTAGHVPLVHAMQERRQEGEVSTLRDLSQFTEDDWLEMIDQQQNGEPIGVPPGIPGADEDEQKRNYARVLARTVEDAFPTAVFAARLRQDGAEEPRRDDLLRFFEEQADFELLEGSVSRFLEHHPEALDGMEEPEAVAGDLRSIRRSFHLAPRFERYDAVRSLRAEGLDAALHITGTGMGEETFVRRYEHRLGGEARTRIVYKNAVQRSTMVETLVADLDPAFHRFDPYAIPKLKGAFGAGNGEFSEEEEAARAEWQSLFGALDFCDCEHCRSVCSPAAYLTDLLHFLDDRPAEDPGAALEALFERRSDIGRITLTCKNTNTPLPYIDLVNEVLEAQIPLFPERDFSSSLTGDLDDGQVPSPLREAFEDTGQISADTTLTVTTERPGRRWSITAGAQVYEVRRKNGALRVFEAPPADTTWNADELRAHPEHVNAAAYERLEQAAYPWSLPFDLHAEEMRAYLDHLGVERHRLMRFLQTGSPSADIDIVAERLSLLPIQHRLITGDAPDRPLYQLWGFNSPAQWIKTLRTNLPQLLDRSRLTFKEFLVLLQTAYVNPDGHLFVRFVGEDGGAPDADDLCNTEQARLVHDDDSLPGNERNEAVKGMLDRLHRFVRLQRALGWTPHELDTALASLGEGADPLNTTFLERLAQLVALRERLGLPLEEALSWYASLSTRPAREPSGEEEAPSFYVQLFLNHTVAHPVNEQFALAPGGDLVGAAGPDTLTEHAATIQAALQIEADAFDRLVRTGSADEGIVPDELTLENLSALYRHASLAHALELAVADLLLLKEIVAQDPFDLANMAGTHAFLDAAERVRAAGFNPSELAYLLRHHQPEDLAEQEDEQVAALLEQIRTALQQIEADLQVPASSPGGSGEEPGDDPLARLLQERLQAVLSPSTTGQTLAILEAEAPSDEETDAWNTFIDAHFDAFMDATERSEAKEKLVEPARLEHREERLRYVLEPLSARLRTQRSREAIKQALAGALNVGAPVAAVLVEQVEAPGTSSAVHQAILASDLAARSDAVTRANYPDLFDGVIRLRKAALIAERLKVAAGDLPSLLKLSEAGGWLALRRLPIAAASPVSFASWERLDLLLQLDRTLPNEAPALLRLLEPLLTFEPSAGDADEVRSDFFRALSQHRGWDEEVLASLAGPTALDLSLSDLVDAHKLRQLWDGMALLKRTGVSVEELKAWSKASVTEAMARRARLAAKAKHSEDVWLKVAEPLRNRLREQQRQALIDYLVPREAGVQDADDLFGQLLIDVEMSSCQMTSRIKQAISSVQLFVQRCLMNLEDVHLSPADAREWKWRKNYRVWEANRKVFLFPQNWIEPELRREKSPFFEELEDELLQQEVTKETAEQAYRRYLEKLSDVARLEVAGLYHEQDDEAGTDILHAFARTRNAPHRYFYRRRVDETFWTPWESVDLDIQGDHLIPAVYNRRLHLFWPEFTEKAVEEVPDVPEQGGNGQDNRPQKYLEIKLAWSVYQDGAWTAKQLSRDAVETLPRRGPLPKKSNFFFKHSEAALDLEEIDNVWVKILLALVLGQAGALSSGILCFQREGNEVRFAGGFTFDYCNNTLSGYSLAAGASSAVRDLYLPEAWSSRFMHLHDSGRLVLPYRSPGGEEEEGNVFDDSRTYLLLPSPQDRRFASQRPFFVFDADDGREFFVTPGDRYEWIEIGGQRGNGTGRGDSWTLNPGFAGGYFDEDRMHIIANWEEVVGGSLPVPGRDPGTVDPEGPVILEGPIGLFGPSDPAGEVAGREPEILGDRELANTFPAHLLRLGAGSEGIPDPNVLGPGLLESSVLGGEAVSRRHEVQPRVIRNDGDGLHTRVMALSTPSAAATNWSVSRDRQSINVAEGLMVENFFQPERARVRIRQWKNKEFRFYTFFHPQVCTFNEHLIRYGIDGLLDPQPGSEGEALRRQQMPEDFDFEAEYEPSDQLVADCPPVADVDFSYGGAYSLYNWELFFHVPFLIATRLSQNQRFEEARQWFHYIFDPTTPPEAEGDRSDPRRFWKLKPFYEEDVRRLREMLLLLSEAADEVSEGGLCSQTEQLEQLRKQVAQWTKHPFEPHRIARLRNVAYMKAVVMKYLDNLIAWGDQLFRRGTLEANNEATQLYVLAAQILGKRPESLPARNVPENTFNDLIKGEGLDAFSNKQVAVEDRLPALPTPLPNGTDAPSTLGRTFFFCIPKNDQLLGYWDTVDDRLFKIRHCMDIEGRAQQLPLFAPPIDPSMLVKAAAAGVDIGQAVGDLFAPLPHYRFRVVHRKALELCADVKALGAALLAALEKKDAETLSQLRARHAVQFQEAGVRVRENQIEEAKEALAGLNKSLEVTQERKKFYANREFMNAWEWTALGLSGASLLAETAIALGYTLAGGLKLIPNFVIGASGFGGSPVAEAETGGDKVGNAAENAVKTLSAIARSLDKGASMAATQGGYQRRKEEWEHQLELAKKEIEQVEKQIAAAEIRLAIAERELENHELQIEQSKEVEDYLSDKYTSEELYSWMISELSTLYFQSYQMAYRMAKRAEKAYQFELGRPDDTFVEFGHWDSLKKGLLSGERLHQELQRMDVSYLDRNRREYELTKQVSLALHAPAELIRLKETGVCEIRLPEHLFDQDYPGHYMRRIKSASLTIPCVTGPYTNVNATLTLVRSAVRMEATPDPEYARQPSDERFQESLGAFRSMATSSASNDHGLFELSFQDERYLPFEGAGAESVWQLELPRDCNRFDLSTITDVVLHLRYTARDGGPQLRQKAREARDAVLEDQGRAVAFSARRNFSAAWHRFLYPEAEEGPHEMTLELTRDRFPYEPAGKQLELGRIKLFFELSQEVTYDDGSPLTYALEKEGTSEVSEESREAFKKAAFGGNTSLPHLVEATPFEDESKALGDRTFRLTSVPSSLQREGGDARLDLEAVEDLLIVCEYTVSDSDD